MRCHAHKFGTQHDHAGRCTALADRSDAKRISGGLQICQIALTGVRHSPGVVWLDCAMDANGEANVHLANHLLQRPPMQALPPLHMSVLYAQLLPEDRCASVPRPLVPCIVTIHTCVVRQYALPVSQARRRCTWVAAA